MATGPGFPTGTNPFIPNWESSGKLAVAYSRNVNKFAIMKYMQLVKSPLPIGYYLKMNAQEAARVVSQNDYSWPRGNVRPSQIEGLESFNFLPFATARKDYGFNLDDDTVDNASWNIAEQHSKIHCQKLMTSRTIRGTGVLTTAANWQQAADPDLSADHTGTATAIAGGKFDVGTSLAPYFMNALNYCANLINLDTLGVVESDALHVVMNNHTASLIGQSPEMHDYLKGSPDAKAEITSGKSPNAKFGLPGSVYGYPVVVENAVKVTSRKGDALVKVRAFPDQTVAIVARIGELEGVFGTPSFSTLTAFWYRDEMTIERFEDRKNRLMEYHVVEDMIEVLTSPLSGYLITACTA